MNFCQFQPVSYPFIKGKQFFIVERVVQGQHRDFMGNF